MAGLCFPEPFAIVYACLLTYIVRVLLSCFVQHSISIFVQRFPLVGISEVAYVFFYIVPFTVPLRVEHRTPFKCAFLAKGFMGSRLTSRSLPVHPLMLNRCGYPNDISVNVVLWGLLLYQSVIGKR